MINKFSNLRVGFSYFELGKTSWRRACREIDAALKENFTNYFSSAFKENLKSDKLDIIIGQSQYCLEQFIRAKRLNLEVMRVMVIATHTESEIEASNRERKACGLQPINNNPLQQHRYKTERLLADYLIVASRRCKSDLLASGCHKKKIIILPYGIQVDKPHFRKNTGNIKFLFVGTDPFRKGIRILFEAWDQLKLKKAELICAVSPEISRSHLLVKYLIRNPTIIIKNAMPEGEFSFRKAIEEYKSIDCQLLPSLHDGFSFVIAEGMGVGKPAIVSDHAGIQDILTHLKDGYIAKSDSVDELKKGILYFYENRNKIKKIGEAAFETAREYSWKRFKEEFVNLVNSLYYNERQPL